MNEKSSTAFGEFVATYGDALKRLAHMTLGDAGLAEDATQAALLKVMRHWTRIEHPRAYARRAVISECIDRQRQARRIKPVPDEEIGVALHAHTAGGPSAADHIVLRAALWQAVKQLPTRQRAVLALKYFEGLNDREVAQALGIREASVRAAASRGLALLRTTYQEAR